MCRMKVLFIFFLFIGGTLSQGNGEYEIETFEVECNSDNITITFNGTYLGTLVSFPVASVYLVDASNPTQEAECMFTPDGNEFAITINDFSICFPVGMNDDDGLLINYIAQLYTSVPPGALVSFDDCYQFQLSCLYESNYTVSSDGGLLPYTKDFVFNNTQSGAFNVEIDVYTDGAFTEIANISGIGYNADDAVYVQLSIADPTTLILQLDNCNVQNDNTGQMINIIDSGCPVAGTPTAVIIQNSVGHLAQFHYPAFQEAGIENSQQFFTINCGVIVCDPAVSDCSPPGCSIGRKRRDAWNGWNEFNIIQMSKNYRILNKCKVDCAQFCLLQEHETCICASDYELEDDGTTCTAKSDDASNDVALDFQPIEDPFAQPVESPPTTSSATTTSATTTSATTTSSTTTNSATTTSTPTTKTTKPTTIITTTNSATTTTKPTTTTTTKPTTTTKSTTTTTKEQKPYEDNLNQHKFLYETKWTSILYYTSYALVGLLCVLLVALCIKKCRNAREKRSYRAFDEEEAASN